MCSQVYIVTWQFLVLLATVSVAALSAFELDVEQQQIQDEEAKARKYLDHLEKEFNKRANIASLVRWAYASNMTDTNLKNQVTIPM
jgi:hypothetical protein